MVTSLLTEEIISIKILLLLSSSQIHHEATIINLLETIMFHKVSALALVPQQHHIYTLQMPFIYI